MVSSLMATLACRQGPPEPSTTLPPAIRRSASPDGGLWAMAECRAPITARLAKRQAEPKNRLNLAAGRSRILRWFGMGFPLPDLIGDFGASRAPLAPTANKSLIPSQPLSTRLLRSFAPANGIWPLDGPEEAKLSVKGPMLECS